MSVVPASQNLANYSQNVVGIFDPTTGAQLFLNAKAMKASIGRSSKLMDHPKEDGSPVSDYKIVLPIEVELGVLIDTRSPGNVYLDLVDAFSKSTFLTVLTNSSFYFNLVIQGMPHEETPDMWGMLTLALKLREVQLVTVQFQQLPAASVATTTDQSTVNSGEQTPQPGPAKGSVLYSAYAAMFKPPKLGQ